MNEYDYLIKKISEEVTAMQDSLGSGNAVDYAQYQNLCGQIRGLLRAEAIVSDLKKRMEQDND